MLSSCHRQSTRSPEHEAHHQPTAATKAGGTKSKTAGLESGLQ